MMTRSRQNNKRSTRSLFYLTSMNRLLLVFVVLLIAIMAHGFRPVPSQIVRFNAMPNNVMKMSDEQASEAEPVQKVVMQGGDDTEDPQLFDMNKRVRLGRSRDQDGKSNIWSIEPTMQVEELEEGETGTKKNLVIAGAVIGAAVACLPLFSAFSKLFPDPSDY
jgi:hypothetical protein